MTLRWDVDNLASGWQPALPWIRGYGTALKIGDFDVRDSLLMSLTDIGPAIGDVFSLVQSAGLGSLVRIPRRLDGTPWILNTAAQMVTSSPPGYLEIVADGGAVIKCTEGASGFPSLNITDNTVQMNFRATKLVFISGIAGNNDDVPRVMNVSCSKIIIDGLQAYGIQGRDGNGVFDLIASQSITVLNSRFAGCCRPTTSGGVLSLSGGSVLLDNCEFLDSSVLQGVGYQKGSPDAFIFIRGANHPVSIRGSSFGQIFTTAAIHHQVLPGNPTALLQFIGCYLEANSIPGATSAPIVLVEGGPTYLPPTAGVVYENCTIADVGGHRTTQQPHLLQQSKGAGPTILRGCYLTSSLAQTLPANYDANLLPAKGIRTMGGGSGPIITDNCVGQNPQFRLRPFFDTEAPVFVENYNGLATVYPANGSTSFYDAAEQVTFSLGALLTGSGATYAAVAANSTLSLTATPNGPLVVTFSGSENSQGTFLTSLNAGLVPANGIQAVNSGGQIQLQAGLMYGASSGAVTAATAGVLASLGLSVSAFTTLARVSALGDQAASTHPLTGACSQRSLDANVNNEWSLVFLAGSGDVLQSATFSAIPQPFTIFLVGRQNDIAATRYAFDGGAADQCSLSAPVGHNLVTLNAGISATAAVADTRNPNIYIWTVNATTSNCRVNSDAPGATISCGTNTLTQFTLGNKGGASPTSAGWDIQACRIMSGAVTLQQARQFNAWASRRFNIALLG